MIGEWRVDDIAAAPGFDPEGQPWPKRGQRLVRLVQDLGGDWQHALELAVPKSVRDEEVLINLDRYL